MLSGKHEEVLIAAPKKTDSDYFQEGQEAHRSNKSRDDNPYTWNPHQNSRLNEVAAYWDQGWESEHEVSCGDG